MTSARDYLPAITARVRREATAWQGEQQEEAADEGPALLPKLAPGAPPPRRPRPRRAGRAARRRPAAGRRRRRELGGVLGRELSQVRVHDDAAGGEVASEVGARAVTVGEHVAFAPGEYRPGTPVGDALLAHELVHVGQQADAGAAGAGCKSGGRRRALEREADTLAAGAVAGPGAGYADGPRGWPAAPVRACARGSACRAATAAAPRSTTPGPARPCRPRRRAEHARAGPARGRPRARRGDPARRPQRAQPGRVRSRRADPARPGAAAARRGSRGTAPAGQARRRVANRARLKRDLTRAIRAPQRRHGRHAPRGAAGRGCPWPASRARGAAPRRRSTPCSAASRRPPR